MINRILGFLRVLRHLPGTIGSMKAELKNVSTHNDANTERVNALMREHKQDVAKLSGDYQDISSSLTAVNITLAKLEASVAKLKPGEIKPAKAQSSANRQDLFAEDESIDAYYKAFEDKFRGSEQDIQEKLKYYLPHFKTIGKNSTVVDIGSGRGELLELLKKNKIKAVGVDLNKDMVKRSKAKGLDAVVADANAYLADNKDQKIGAITAFHLAEHLPFRDLLTLFRSCYNALEPGGFVIFETPNPESLLVGTNNFYTDPSHLNPIPPATMKFSLESVGFIGAEIHRLHPFKEVNIDHLDSDVAEIVKRYFGPRDYSVIAYKPGK